MVPPKNQKRHLYNVLKPIFPASRQGIFGEEAL